MINDKNEEERKQHIIRPVNNNKNNKFKCDYHSTYTYDPYAGNISVTFC